MGVTALADKCGLTRERRVQLVDDESSRVAIPASLRKHHRSANSPEGDVPESNAASPSRQASSQGKCLIEATTLPMSPPSRIELANALAPMPAISPMPTTMAKIDYQDLISAVCSAALARTCLSTRAGRFIMNGGHKESKAGIRQIRFLLRPVGPFEIWDPATLLRPPRFRISTDARRSRISARGKGDRVCWPPAIQPRMMQAAPAYPRVARRGSIDAPRCLSPGERHVDATFGAGRLYAGAARDPLAPAYSRSIAIPTRSWARSALAGESDEQQASTLGASAFLADHGERTRRARRRCRSRASTMDYRRVVGAARSTRPSAVSPFQADGPLEPVRMSQEGDERGGFRQPCRRRRDRRCAVRRYGDEPQSLAGSRRAIVAAAALIHAHRRALAQMSCAARWATGRMTRRIRGDAGVPGDPDPC